MQVIVDFIFGFIMQRVVTSPRPSPVVNSQIVYELSCIAYYVISFTFIVALRPQTVHIIRDGDDVVSYSDSLLNAAPFKLSEYVSLSLKFKPQFVFTTLHFPVAS